MKSSDTYVLTNSNLSYTRAIEIFFEAVEAVGEDKSKFCLHSLRSGGASAASNSDVEERLVMTHGRWSRISSKDDYVKMIFLNVFQLQKIWAFINFFLFTLFSPPSLISVDL